MLLDIGVGIILSIVVSKWLGVALAGSFVVGGILFSLLPDIDVVAELLKYRNLGGYTVRIHREWVHYPFLYPVISVVVYYFLGAVWVALFASGLLWHFLHDSVGPGWGIKWFGPFSKKNYKFFSEKDGTVSNRVVVSWTPDELAETLKKHHNPNWFRDIYLSLSFINVIEFIGFVVGLIALYILWK